MSAKSSNPFQIPAPSKMKTSALANKWKIVSAVFIILAVLFFILMVIFLILYLSGSNCDVPDPNPNTTE